jgi:hypothetical protein
MKKLLFILFFLPFVFYSCVDKINTYSENELVVRDDTTYVSFTMTPVTGNVINLGKGKWKSECAYKDGKKHGEEKLWAENGRLVGFFNYHQGEFVNLMEMYWENGQLARRTDYGQFMLAALDRIYGRKPPSDCWDNNGNEIDCESTNSILNTK